MKTVTMLIFSLCAILYAGDPKVTFKPFSISFERPYIPFAIFFLAMAVIFYTMQFHKIGYKKGVEDTINVVKEIAAEAEDELNG